MAVPEEQLWRNYKWNQGADRTSTPALYTLEIKVDVATPERKEKIPVRRSTREAAKRANQSINKTVNEPNTDDSQRREECPDCGTCTF